MSWTVLIALVLALGLAFVALLARRVELTRMRRRLAHKERVAGSGGAEAQLRHPVVDLSRCLGCGTCVRSCPEQGVLELVHGQAVVVNGAACVGHAACERECPVGAITVALANLAERRDVPVIDARLEAVGAPGLFLAGELTAHALIKPAIEQGVRVASEVARRAASGVREPDALDLCIVGAGPAGLACALEAKRLGLDFVVLEQEAAVGGTVAKYPRRKLVLSQPVELPLHGPLGGREGRTEFTKEELIELWNGIAEREALPVRGGEGFEGLERDERGRFVVSASRLRVTARHVCLALGRRGTPRKLGVSGEELPKVAFALLDARSYVGRRVLVVGGGDSAVEAALGLAEQPGSEVTLSYRKEAFIRLRARNEERIAEAQREGRVRVLFESEVRAIRADEVELAVRDGSGERGLVLPNDEVFVLIGGSAPFELLERSGVSFDPKLRPAPPPLVEQGTGLVPALGAAFALALVALGFALWNADYYLLPGEVRPTSSKHAWLRPGLGLGLVLGIAATVLVGANLLYLLRRSGRLSARWGSLRAWMTSHVATGVLAVLCALLHGAMAPRDTVGGHAFWALLALLVTGAVGRYFYAAVPRAANGRELELEEVRRRLSRLSEAWDESQRAFAQNARVEVERLVEARQWTSSFLGRALALVGGQRDLRRACARLAREGEAAGLPADRVQVTLGLAREAHRVALAAAHYEDLRAVLGSWRYLHRWLALLLVILIGVHVFFALAYGAALYEGVAP
jgi:thioredoxin reductase/NAD-dependent dihydropyrimidine dehydrogenase PreA subunit